MTRRIALLLAALLIAALLIPALATHVAHARPPISKRHNVDTNIVHTITFPITETGVDSQPIEVNGLCSVVYESAGAEDVSLYAVETTETATGAGVLIVAYTDSSTVPTVFQPGTRWVKAVAASAVTGGSQMRITCSNTQLASTGEACGTSGLAPYVGTGGRYKCEVDYSYDEDNNELRAGSISLDPVAGKNVVRFPGISGFTGPDPDSTSVLLYGLSADQELYVENLDGLNTPSRVVIASPDYYDVVLSWGVAFIDVNNEYADLGSPTGTPVVNKFCMVRGSHVNKEEIYTTSVEAETITIPLSGANGCTASAGATKPNQAYALMGDPWIADAWCTTHTNLDAGATLWQEGDEVIIRFGVNNAADLVAPEYLVSAHTMTFGFDEINAWKGAVGRHTELREVVDIYSSSAFSGGLSPGAVDMVLFTASIEGMTREIGSTWNAIQLNCSIGILFKDTR